MKTLHIVRHAKSSWKHDLNDHDRPLNKRGKINAPFMADKFAKSHAVDAIYSSTAKRALTTAKRFSEALGISKSDIKTTTKIYHAGVDALMEVIHDFDNREDSVMIFGHNPGFSSLVRYLDNSSNIYMVTCARATLVFEVDDWSAVIENMGQVVEYDYPRKYPEMENL